MYNNTWLIPIKMIATRSYTNITTHPLSAGVLFVLNDEKQVLVCHFLKRAFFALYHRKTFAFYLQDMIDDSELNVHLMFPFLLTFYKNESIDLSLLKLNDAVSLS